MNTKILSTPPGNHPRASILSQNDEVDVNVKFAAKVERSPQRQSTKSGGKISQHRARRKAELETRQLTLWSPQLHPDEFACQKRQKPQISSISGISLRERNRYRVMLGNQILGEFLTLDEALQLAKQGGRDA